LPLIQQIAERAARGDRLTWKSDQLALLGQAGNPVAGQQLGRPHDAEGRLVALCASDIGHGVMVWTLEQPELAAHRLVPMYLITEEHWRAVMLAELRGDRVLLWEGKELALTACWVAGTHVAVLQPRRSPLRR
jgi:hypothetical protein